MFYLINEQIIYDDINFSVTNSETHDTIPIPATAARLLSLFIKYHGSTLSRDEILHHVWEEYGYKASNNTLTQYVSLLRKNFQSLGINEDTIVTIPRIGFMLSKDLKVSFTDNIESSFPLRVESSQNDTACSPLLSNKQKKQVDNTLIAIRHMLPIINVKYIKKRPYVYFSCIIFVLAIVLAIYTCVPDTKTAEVYQVGMIDSCPVYMFYHSSKEMLPARMLLTTNIAKEKLPCVNKNIYLAQQEDILTFGNPGRIFISRCAYQAGSSTLFSNCKSIYSHENQK